MIGLSIGLLILHGGLCLICFWFRKNGIWQKEENLMPVILGVPVFGVACQLVYEYAYHSGMLEKRAEDVERLEIKDVRYKRIEVEEGSREIVPLEEAFLLNNAKTRRQMMLDILHKNPGQYVGMLQKAGNSNDTEVIHYATTMMMEIMTDYEKKLQECRRAYEAAPEEKETLAQYIQTFLEFMKSGLVTGSLMEVYSKQTVELLEQYDKKFGVSYAFLYAWIENLLYLGENKKAKKRLETAQSKYGKEEKFYMLYGQYYYNTKDYGGMRRLINEMKEQHMYLDKEGRKWLEFWDEEAKRRDLE